MSLHRFEPGVWKGEGARFVPVLFVLAGGAILLGMSQPLPSEVKVGLSGGLLALLCLGVARGAWKLRSVLAAFELELADDAIVARSGGREVLRLDRREVREVVEEGSGALRLVGPTPARTLTVKPSLEGFEVLAASLRGWAPLRAEASPRVDPLLVVAAILAMALFASQLVMQRAPGARVGAALLLLLGVWGGLRLRGAPALWRWWAFGSAGVMAAYLLADLLRP